MARSPQKHEESPSPSGKWKVMKKLGGAVGRKGRSVSSKQSASELQENSDCIRPERSASRPRVTKAETNPPVCLAKTWTTLGIQRASHTVRSDLKVSHQTRHSWHTWAVRSILVTTMKLKPQAEALDQNSDTPVVCVRSHHETFS